MTSALLQPIPPQTFEICREQIAKILYVELKYQETQYPGFQAPQQVDIERRIQYNSENDYPAVNVWFDSGIFNTKTQDNKQTTYTFNIDVYTNSASLIPDENDPTQFIQLGDTLAGKKMTQIMGMISAIFDSPIYESLGWTGNKDVRILNTYIQGMASEYKSEAKDALSDILGRVVYVVRTNEPALQLQFSNQFKEGDTAITVNDGVQGYYITSNPTQ